MVESACGPARPEWCFGHNVIASEGVVPVRREVELNAILLNRNGVWAQMSPTALKWRFGMPQPDSCKRQPIFSLGTWVPVKAMSVTKW
jgi:hypothetical protein